MKNFTTLLFLVFTLIITSCSKESAQSLEMITSHIIVGDLDWEDVTSIESGDAKRVNAARVGKIDLPAIGSRCTAFLIAQDVVMTNHHCITSASSAVGAKVQFKFEKGVSASGYEEFSCDKFIGNDSALDYALLKCSGSPGRKFGHVQLADVDASSIGDAIYIIQQNCDYYMDRGCQPTKKIAFGNITEIHAEFTHNVDTLGGSSGSPVFDSRSGKVLAIHHAGYGNNGLGRGIENYAVPMHLIVADIQTKFPGVISDASADPGPVVIADHSKIENAKSIDDKFSGEFALSSNQKQHFYKIEVKSSKTISMKINFSNRVGDLDMQLVDSKGRVIASSASISDQELISKQLISGSYVLKVYGYKNATGQYKLVTF